MILTIYVIGCAVALAGEIVATNYYDTAYESKEEKPISNSDWDSPIPFIIAGVWPLWSVLWPLIAVGKFFGRRKLRQLRANEEHARLLQEPIGELLDK